MDSPKPLTSLRLRDRLVLLLARLWVSAANPLFVAHTAYKDRRLPNPACPRTSREKMLWRKLFDRNPLFVTACDKLACKAYARSRSPELKFAEVLWSGPDPAEIPDALLEGEVVVKANHGSGWYLLLRGERNIAEVKRRAAVWARRRFGWRLGEWAYSQVTRGILVEEMLLHEGRPVPKQYRFHVAGGQIAYVIYGRSNPSEARINLDLDEAGRAYEVTPAGERHPVAMEAPKTYARARRIAEALGADFDYLRCDLYDMDDELYFSELTVYPNSGHGRKSDKGPRARLSELWDLRRAWFLSTPQSGWRRLYAEALRHWLELEAQTAARKTIDTTLTNNEDREAHAQHEKVH